MNAILLMGKINALNSSIAQKLPKHYTAADIGKYIGVNGEKEAVPMTPVLGDVTIDPTLTTPDAAADAKATGDKIRKLEKLNGYLGDVGEIVKCPNILDKTKLVSGYVNSGNGNIIADDGYRTSDYIPVIAGQTIGYVRGTGTTRAGSGMMAACFYDASKQRVSGAAWPEYGTCTAPSGAAFLRFSYAKSGFENEGASAYVIESATDVPAFVAYFDPYYRLDVDGTFSDANTPAPAKATGDRFDSDEADIAELKSVLTVIKSRNLWYPTMEGIERNKSLNANGTLYDDDGKTTSGFIYVGDLVGKTLRFYNSDSTDTRATNTGFRVAVLYDADKNVISGGGLWLDDVVIPNGCAYVRFTHQTSYLGIGEGAVNGLVIAVDDGENINSYKPYFEPFMGNAYSFYAPKKMYVMVGHTYEIYFDALTAWTTGHEYSVSATLTGNYGSNLKVFPDKVRFTPETANTKLVGFKLWHNDVCIDTIAINLIAVAPTEETISLIPFGDSVTNHSRWEAELENMLSGTTCVGTRGFNNIEDSDGTLHNIYNEGRAGFTTKNYINGSPYTGATDRGGDESPNHRWYDPDNAVFSMEYYMENHFPDGQATPNAVSVLIGINDLVGGRDNDVITANVKTILDDMRAYDADLKIVLVAPFFRANKYTTLAEKLAMVDLAKMYEALAETYENMCYVPLLIAFDSTNNFPMEEVSVNTRNPETVKNVVDITHPSNYGYWQFADVIAGGLSYLFSL